MIQIKKIVFMCLQVHKCICHLTLIKSLQSENYWVLRFSINFKSTPILSEEGPPHFPHVPPDIELSWWCWWQGLTLDLANENSVVNSWGSELSSPHDVALSRGGEAVYVAEIGPNGIRKFEVVTPAAEMFWAGIEIVSNVNWFPYLQDYL